jgi:mannose-6-phosphate isomerase-like protein (cupin superfamily)
MTQHALTDALSTVLLIGPQDRTVLPGPANAPFRRELCYDDGHAWVGIVTTEPGSASPWHHHGDYDTFAYLLEGEAVVEFGDDGQSLHLSPDESVGIVPKGLPHRELNPGTVPNKFLIVRVGHGPAVIPVER